MEVNPGSLVSFNRHDFLRIHQLETSVSFDAEVQSHALPELLDNTA